MLYKSTSKPLPLSGDASGLANTAPSVVAVDSGPRIVCVRRGELWSPDLANKADPEYGTLQESRRLRDSSPRVTYPLQSWSNPPEFNAFEWIPPLISNCAPSVIREVISTWSYLQWWNCSRCCDQYKLIRFFCCLSSPQGSSAWPIGRFDLKLATGGLALNHPTQQRLETRGVTVIMKNFALGANTLLPELVIFVPPLRLERRFTQSSSLSRATSRVAAQLQHCRGLNAFVDQGFMLFIALRNAKKKPK